MAGITVWLEHPTERYPVAAVHGEKSDLVKLVHKCQIRARPVVRELQAVGELVSVKGLQPCFIIDRPIRPSRAQDATFSNKRRRVKTW